MTAEQVDDAIASARSTWASAIDVLMATGDSRDAEAAEGLKHLHRELPVLDSDTDVVAWSTPLDRAVGRLQEVSDHDFAQKVQWSFIDVLIVHRGGLRATPSIDT